MFWFIICIEGRGDKIITLSLTFLTQFDLVFNLDLKTQKKNNKMKRLNLYQEMLTVDNFFFSPMSIKKSAIGFNPQKKYLPITLI